MKKGRIMINNFSGGWTPDFIKTGAGAAPTSQGQYTEGVNNNIYRGGYLGQLSSSPRASEVALSGTLSIPTVSYYDTRAGFNSNLIYTISGTELIKTNLNTSVSTVITTGISATQTGSIIKFVDTTTGSFNPTVFVLTATRFLTLNASDVVSLDQTPAGFALPSALIDANAPKQMIIGPDNKLYFTNGDSIGVYNPNTPSYNARQQLIAVGYYAHSICNYGNYIAILANNKNQNSANAKLYIWDGASATFASQHDVGDTFGLALIEEDGQLIIVSAGLGGTLKFKKFNGSNVQDTADYEMGQDTIEPFSILDQGAGRGEYELFNPNRITYTRGQFFLQGYDGKIYSWGSPYKRNFFSGFHCVFNPEITAPALFGGVNRYPVGFLLANPRKNALYAGYRKNNGTPSVVSLDFDNLANVNLSGVTQISTWTSPLYELPNRANLERVVFDLSSFSLPTSFLQIKIYKDYNQTIDLTNNEKFISFNNNGEILYWPVNVLVGDTQTFYFKLTYSACTIKTMSIEYSYSDLSA